MATPLGYTPLSLDSSGLVRNPDDNALGTFGSWWNQLSGKGPQSDQTYNALQASLDRIWQSDEAEKARVFSSAEAASQRQWEEYMSNTAYSRAIADMKSAGINPAATGGLSPASTPSGASAQSPGIPSGSRASAYGAGSGGFAGVIAGIAKMAIGQALFAKFTNSAQRAADSHELISSKIKKMAVDEAASTARTAREKELLKSEIAKNITQSISHLGHLPFQPEETADASYAWYRRHFK